MVSSSVNLAPFVACSTDFRLNIDLLPLLILLLLLLQQQYATTTTTVTVFSERGVRRKVWSRRVLWVFRPAGAGWVCSLICFVLKPTATKMLGSTIY